jgi:hypothetical protein
VKGNRSVVHEAGPRLAFVAFHIVSHTKFYFLQKVDTMLLGLHTRCVFSS